MLHSACSTSDNEALDLPLDLPTYQHNEVRLDQVELSTIKSKSSRTDNLDFALIGLLNDSIYGSTQATFYTQIGLGGLVNIPKNAIIDSVVFRLNFIGGYGNSSFKHNYGLFEVADSFELDSKYTNTSNLALGSKLAEINQKRFTANSKSLSFRIDNFWHTSNAFVGKEYSSSSQIQKEIIGFAVQANSSPEVNDGYVGYFSPTNAESGVFAHYHYYERNDKNELIKTDALLQLTFKDGTKRFSQVLHDYNGAPVQAYLNADSTSASRGFVQAIGGSTISINLPELTHFRDSGEIAIQKAELVLPAELNVQPANLPPLLFLDLKTKNPAGTVVDVLDRGNFYWARNYSSAKGGYVYLITSEVQYMLTEHKRDEEFKIQPLILQPVVNDPIAFSAGRIVIKGGKSTRKDGAHINLYYSKLDPK
ncbi:MAG: DUF4270 family protein [Bacteroidetes bacterium]|nr:DUF4270 family protein [Bacteroidota bacterium]